VVQVLLNQGTIYASLLRLQQRRWISASWGLSDNNRRAKYYAITKAGKRQVKADRSKWERLSAVMGRVVAASARKPPSVRARPTQSAAIVNPVAARR
jgi:DNA-binding PadR family transcriptional regulator